MSNFFLFDETFNRRKIQQTKPNPDEYFTTMLAKENIDSVLKVTKDFTEPRKSYTRWNERHLNVYFRTLKILL